MDLIDRLRTYAKADDLHPDERATLLKAAAAIESAREDGWQPIDTAPKDELILIADDRRNVFVAAWNGGDPEWKWAIADIAYLTLGDEPDGMHENRPTHWMPLPAPPAIDQARGKGEP